MNFNLPEHCKIVDATAGCVTTNGGVTSDYVSLKNVLKAWVSVQLTQAVGHATVIALMRATAVAPTGAVVVANVVPIWENEDTASSDTLVRQTDAINLTVTNDVKKKQVIFEVDPATLGATYDCLGFTVSDSSQATNFVAGQFILYMRYKEDTPPVAITD